MATYPAFTFLLISSLPAAGGWLFQSCVHAVPPQHAQSEPGWLSTRSDRLWHWTARTLVLEAKTRRDRQRAGLLEEARKVPGIQLPEEDENELATEGQYGKLPDVVVDWAYGAIFPTPLSPPTRFSWYQVTLEAGRLLRLLRRTDHEIDRWKKLSISAKTDGFQGVENKLNQLAAAFSALAQRVRYLETWVPQLEHQWAEHQATDEVPDAYRVAQALSERDFKLFEPLRELLRPQRVMKRSFLPETLTSLPAGILVLPIATDISDRRFVAELEGAISSHWNQSYWARKNGVTIQVKWTTVPKNRRFASGQETLLEHLNSFPRNMTILTTGALTTHVRDRALILGPGKVNPRTLAHEIGHLLGFADCYLRTMTGQGFFGLGVLEWDNPLFPDDLMCDNTVGAPRAVAW